MTIEKVRYSTMLIGHHFGKRKPQWNFFIKSYENFKYSSASSLVKMLSLGLIIQSLLFSPVIYWIYQNYAIIESRLPAHLNLDENIQFEKKWIIFLFIGMSLMQCFWNYSVWKKFIENSPDLQQEPIRPLKSVSHDEADYQHRAS